MAPILSAAHTCSLDDLHATAYLAMADGLLLWYSSFQCLYGKSMTAWMNLKIKHAYHCRQWLHCLGVCYQRSCDQLNPRTSMMCYCIVAAQSHLTSVQIDDLRNRKLPILTLFRAPWQRNVQMREFRCFCFFLYAR